MVATRALLNLFFPAFLFVQQLVFYTPPFLNLKKKVFFFFGKSFMLLRQTKGTQFSFFLIFGFFLLVLVILFFFSFLFVFSSFFLYLFAFFCFFLYRAKIMVWLCEGNGFFHKLLSFSVFYFTFFRKRCIKPS